MFSKYLQQKRAQRRLDEIATNLYLATVAQARDPVFYEKMGVPDTIDGRFEMITLHTCLVMRRLKDLGSDGSNLSQAYFDAMFHDMDRNLRELGVSDMAVGKRMKKMMQGFYGRVAAYDLGLADEDHKDLRAAIARNVYGTVDPQQNWISAMVIYVGRLAAEMDSNDLLAFENLTIKFPLAS